MKCAWRLSGAAASLPALALIFCSGSSLGQQSASVTVNAGSSLGTIPGPAFGVNTACWDVLLFDSPVPGLLKSAGVTLLRFPGGSTSDVYHWQN